MLQFKSNNINNNFKFITMRTMRNILILILILFSSSSIKAQTLFSYVKNRVESHLSSNLGDRYKGGVEISDATEVNGAIIVEGTFRYQIKLLIGGNGNVVTRKFKARAKKVLDDISIKNLCYVHISYAPDGSNSNSCSCTITHDNELCP